jgi:hypothetical protein
VLESITSDHRPTFRLVVGFPGANTCSQAFQDGYVNTTWLGALATWLAHQKNPSAAMIHAARRLKAPALAALVVAGHDCEPVIGIYWMPGPAAVFLYSAYPLVRKTFSEYPGPRPCMTSLDGSKSLPKLEPAVALAK